jgi:anhydro-N-acetylmuramic acid kinase
MPESLLVGLMSGTSMDAIDAALVKVRQDGAELVSCLEYPIKPALREEIKALSQSGADEIERLGQLDRRLGQYFAQATLDLLSQAGVDRRRVRAIGSHGQTIRHRPASAAAGCDSPFTLQIGDPNTIAEITGITTVADFRRRDIAAGGEGAPLAPAFHAAAFSKPGGKRAIINIGGIANITLLDGGPVRGFDSGPGNTLLDHWVNEHRGQRYDHEGSWAAEGSVDEALLQQLLGHPYLQAAPPKSTGKEVFNLDWLKDQLAHFPDLQPGDVQATLAEFTASSIQLALQQQGDAIEEIYICGGGAANGDLMRRIYRLANPAHLGTTSELGCDPAWVEAAAFAWLAHRTLEGLSGNLPAVTGAIAERVLGAIYPGNG